MRGVVNAENGGYPIITKVHDEPIAEVPDTSDYKVEKLCTFMTTNIPWASGLPLAAAGFETHTYHKE